MMKNEIMNIYILKILNNLSCARSRQIILHATMWMWTFSCTLLPEVTLVPVVVVPSTPTVPPAGLPVLIGEGPCAYTPIHSADVLMSTVLFLPVHYWSTILVLSSVRAHISYFRHILLYIFIYMKRNTVVLSTILCRVHRTFHDNVMIESIQSQLP